MCIRDRYGFQSPNSIAVNQRSDEVLVSDYGPQQIIVVALLPDNGVYPDTVSSEHYFDQLNGTINGPVAVAITNYSEANGVMILVADKINNRIERVPYNFYYGDANDPGPITDVTQPIALTPPLNCTWIIQEDGPVRYFETNSGSSSNIITLEELTSSKPRVIAGDYLKDAVWIGDNTENKIIKDSYK